MTPVRFGDLAEDTQFYDPNWFSGDSPLFTKIEEHLVGPGSKVANAESEDCLTGFKPDDIVIPIGYICQL